MPPMGPPNRNRNQKKQKPKNTKATAKRLFSYLEQEKHKIAAAFVCVLVSSASTLCGSYLLRPIINGLIDSTKTSQQKITSLMAGLALMAVVYVLGVGATYLQGRIMISVSQGTLKRIREHLFRKVQKLPVRYFDTNPTGDIMSRFTNDVDIIGEMLNSTLVQIFSGTITLIGTLALMLYTNWVLAVVTIVVSPIIVKTSVINNIYEIIFLQCFLIPVPQNFIQQYLQNQSPAFCYCCYSLSVILLPAHKLLFPQPWFPYLP
mgnify:CR=1 FL=1